MKERMAYMTEKDYISLLDEALSVRGVAKRQDILDDYRQHFSDGRAAGQNDDEIIRHLGPPDEVAGEYTQDTAPQVPLPTLHARHHRWPLIAAIAVVCALSLSALIIALNRPVAVLSAPDQITAPPVPDHSSISELNDFVNGILDEVRQGLSVLDGMDWGNVGIGVGNTSEAAYKPLDYSQVFNDVDSVAVVGSWNLGCLFSRSTDNSVRVELSGEIPEAHDVVVTLDGGVLLIKYNDNGHRAINISVSRQALVTIYLPENWDGLAEAHTLSGNVSVKEGVSLGSLTVGAVSGGITAAEISCGALTINTTSGDVSLSIARIESMMVSTISGDISVRLPGQPQTMTLSSISGDVSLYMDGDYVFSFSSVSGSLHNEAQGREGSGGYSFSTVSGDILLRNYL